MDSRDFSPGICLARGYVEVFEMVEAVRDHWLIALAVIVLVAGLIALRYVRR